MKSGGQLIAEDLSIDSFSGFSGRLYRSCLLHPYEQMFSTDVFVQYLAQTGFSINGFDNANPLKLIRFFFLVAVAL